MKTKTCFKCHLLQPITEFYRHRMMGDGFLGKCKTCAKKDVRANYALNRESYSAYDQERHKSPERRAQIAAASARTRSRNPEKAHAWRAVWAALKSGHLTKRPCEVCGEEESQAHHDDYSKPLDVRWLCFPCHRAVHGQSVTIRKVRSRIAS